MSLIPTRVKIDEKVEYEIVWIDSFKDPKQMGECRYRERQIVIKKDLDQLEELMTYIHELAHAMDHHHKLKLTHKQVYGLENAVRSFLVSNGIV